MYEWSAFQWRFADPAPLIFHLWQEGHEKTAFPSVYEYLFLGSNCSLDNNNPKEGSSDTCPSGGEDVDRLGDSIAYTDAVDCSALPEAVELNAPEVIPSRHEEEVETKASCQGIDSKTGKEQQQPPLKPKRTTTATKETFVNEDAELQRHVIVPSCDDDGMEEQKLLVFLEEKECSQSSSGGDLELRTKHAKSIKSARAFACDVVEEREEESSAPAATPIPKVLVEDCTGAVIPNELAISSANYDRQPAVNAAVVEVQNRNSRNVGNKVIIPPAIELRIDEDDEVMGASLMEDIKPVGGAAVDRGGGLRKSVEGDAEIAICSNDDDQVGGGDYNNNSKTNVIRDYDEDDDDAKLLISEIATNADVHPVPGQVMMMPAEDNHKASGEEVELLVDKESAAIAISHNKVGGEGGVDDEGKVIVAKGEREHDVSNCKKEENILIDAAKSTIKGGDQDYCDRNANCRNEITTGEGVKTTLSAQGEKSNQTATTEGMLIARESNRVGGNDDDGERNVNVQIRRKQYDIIAKFDDYITATSSSSMDDLDTVSKSSFDELDGGSDSVLMESGSESVDVKEQVNSSREEDTERTDFWIKEVLKEQEKWRGGMVSVVD